jgi:hypothetical protein
MYCISYSKYWCMSEPVAQSAASLTVD